MRFWVFVGGTVVLTAALVYIAFTSALLVRKRPLPFNPLLHPVENAFRLFLIGVTLGLMGGSGLPAERFGLGPLPDRNSLGLAVVLGVVGAWAVNAVSRLVANNVAPGWYSRNALESLRPRSAGQLVGVCVAALPAALLEELLFRGIWVGGLSTWFPATWLVFLGALLFGGLHLAQGVWGVLMAAAMGVALGIAFVMTGTLWPVVVAHWAMNVNQFVVAYKWPAFFGLEQEE